MIQDNPRVLATTDEQLKGLKAKYSAMVSAQVNDNVVEQPTEPVITSNPEPTGAPEVNEPSNDLFNQTVKQVLEENPDSAEPVKLSDEEARETIQRLIKKHIENDTEILIRTVSNQNIDEKLNELYLQLSKSSNINVLDNGPANIQNEEIMQTTPETTTNIFDDPNNNIFGPSI